MNIPFAKPHLFGKENEYLADALVSSWISDGTYIDRFEKRFLGFYPWRYGLTVSSGTTALHLALLALDIGPGDEVIVPGYTFVAPVNMAIAVGATPVYADVDPLTWCLDPAAVRKCITSKTKAIIAVHIYGNMCGMPVLKAIAAEHNIFLIEDAAQAAFSQYDGNSAGTFSDMACFSFQATKTIAMGEGGFVLTRHQNLNEKMRIIRDHGMTKEKRYWHEVIGYNFRLTNLQAAVGCAQLERLDDIISAKKSLQRLYRENLINEEGITLQCFEPPVQPVLWSTAIKMEPQFFNGSRDQIMQLLKEAGIETRPGFYGFHRLPPYKDRAPVLPVAGTLGEQIILLPCFLSLTPEQVDFICGQIKNLRRPFSADTRAASRVR